MKTLPSFVAYKMAQDDLIDYAVVIRTAEQLKISELTRTGPSSVMKNWVPGTDLKFSLRYDLSKRQILECCDLSADDELYLLILASHLGTKTSEKWLIPIDQDDPGSPRHFEFSPNSELLSQEIAFELILIVKPSPGDRPQSSATEANTILWKAELSLELERMSALGEVRSDNLAGALWKFNIELPNEPETWSDLEWNYVVQIVVDKESVELIQNTLELKAVMFAELFMFIFQAIFEFDDGFEKLLAFQKVSSFGREMRKFFRHSFPPEFSDPTMMKAFWEADRSAVFLALQRNALRTLRALRKGNLVE